MPVLIRSWLRSNSLNESWPFFVPPLFIYAVGWGLGLSPSVIALATQLACLALLPGLVLRLAQWGRRHWNEPEFWYWLLLLAAVLLPGAFLEYPSDCWEHVRRIFSWEGVLRLDQGEMGHKYAYFFNWCWMRWIPTGSRRFFLSGLSAAWQMAWLFQFYRLFLSLGLSRASARLQVLGVFCFFGTNLFGIRYYALSSSPLAAMAMLGGLMAILDFTDGKRSALGRLLFVLVIIAWNHTQEIYLLGVGAAVLGLLGLWSRFSPRIRVIFLWLGLTLWIASLLGARALIHWNGGLLGYPTGGYLTGAGIIAIWRGNTAHFQTLGLIGFCNAFLALLLFGRNPKAAVLTLAPWVLFLTPFLSWVTLYLGRDLGDTYRFFYLFPQTFFFVLAVEGLFAAFLKIDGRFAPLLPGISLIVLALFPGSPVRGKLWSQLSPSRFGTVRWADGVAGWIRRHRRYSSACWILSDNATHFVVSAHLGLRFDRTLRREPNRLGREIHSVRDVERLVHDLNVCAIVLPPSSSSEPLPDDNAIGKLSGHWEREQQNLDWLLPPDARSALAEYAKNRGWRLIQVEGGTTLFEPPPAVRWTMLNVNKTEQQGDAHLLEFTDGFVALIDSGYSGEAIAHYLKDARVDALDAFIVSHPHQDHYRGIEQVLQSGVKIRTVYANTPPRNICDREKPWGCDYGHFRGVLHQLRGRGAVLTTLQPGAVLHEVESACLRVLYAYDGVHTPVGETDINDTSAVLRLSVGTKSALFTGDLNHAIGTHLARGNRGIESDILKVPHHAAEATVPTEFLERVGARYAMVPAPKVLWESDRVRRVRGFLTSRRIITYVNGTHGQVTLFLTADDISLYSNTTDSPCCNRSVTR